MTKEKYIIELRKRLSLLDEIEVDQIISEYMDFIKQKENEGLNEKDILDQLGDVNKLANNILKSYKISDHYISLFIGKEKVIDELSDFAHKVANASSSLFHKLEESFIEFTKSSGKVAKNAYEETVKFSENRVKDIKTHFKKKENNTNEEDKEE